MAKIVCPCPSKVPENGFCRLGPMAVQVQLPLEPSMEASEMSFPSRMVTPAKLMPCSLTSLASPESCWAVVSV